MALPIIFALLVISLLVVVGAPIVRLLTQRRVQLDPSWLDEFHISRYQPMLRLFDQEDRDFLRSVPNCDRATIRKFEADRRRIFRTYLKRLVRDFNQLQLVAKYVVANADTDSSEQFIFLVKQTLCFRYQVLMAQTRVNLYAAGVAQVDLSGLLVPLQQTESRIQDLALHGAAA